MNVNKYDLFLALLYSTEKTPQMEKLMHWLEENMTSAGGVVIELEKVE